MQSQVYLSFAEATPLLIEDNNNYGRKDIEKLHSKILEAEWS
jgi:hypothetical protein